MIDERSRAIFQKGSRTYYFSSLFFPEPFKSDVFTLYAFVRCADDLVDLPIPNVRAFNQFTADTWHCLDSSPRSLPSSTVDPVIQNFCSLAKRVGIERKWIEAFLTSMRLDLYKSHYYTIEETEWYMYGSAEVIGLMLARIFQLPSQSYSSARLLGRAMQFINMIRDIKEDLDLGRVYLPINEYKKYGLPTEGILTQKIATSHLHEFEAYIRAQLGRQMEWMLEAERGFHFLPRLLRLPVATASEMYDWTAVEIWKNPMIVWEKSLKPSSLRVITNGISHYLS